MLRFPNKGSGRDFYFCIGKPSKRRGKYTMKINMNTNYGICVISQFFLRVFSFFVYSFFPMKAYSDSHKAMHPINNIRQYSQSMILPYESLKKNFSTIKTIGVQRKDIFWLFFRNNINLFFPFFLLCFGRQTRNASKRFFDPFI